MNLQFWLNEKTGQHKALEQGRENYRDEESPNEVKTWLT